MIRTLLLAAVLATPATAETIAVTAAHLLDPATGKTIDNPVVVVTDGHVVASGSGIAIPADARRIDLPGMTLLPGLIDLHVHLTGDAAIGGYRRYAYTDGFWTIVGVANAKTTLDAGFTTVRNVGSDHFDDVALRQAIDAGLIAGPRIITAAYAIGATGGHCDNATLPPSYDRKDASIVDSPEEARAKVRWLHKYGAQVIKICATGGVFSTGDAVGAQQLTFDEMKAIADEAHMLGMKVAAHAHGDDGIRTAIMAGVDTIEHASLASDATIALAKAHGSFFDMDIYNDDYILATGTANGTSQESLDKEKTIGLKQRQTFQRAVRAGVKMGFATDAGVYPHGTNARQFATMVQWGMTPLQAIRAATTTAALALGRTDVGALEPGDWGDMIAVAGDPLGDVKLLQAIPVVIKGGVLVKDGRTAK
ncbi:Xaa-Pro dipeptidase [Glacieibacterium megasporae]|uniref:Xaa-Pro dipeptidase n=1 Tax=Glacieibacterium megasporae TaxID=2835787 RepID=UPI001C1DF939|nr:amidohydrolase family protein [Polymorphobacter megasporae]UAJ11162.1 amidohydrolase family protein [Polymorphobacter megasporae]